jgi:hypothetical protein
MPVSPAQVTGSLESAVTLTLTRTAYAIIMHERNTSILLFCCGLSYVLLDDTLATIGEAGAAVRGASALEVAGGALYLVIGNYSTGLEVWRTVNGIDWQQVNSVRLLEIGDTHG